jgi:uncharacterized protein YdiU (UPF0061 family)
MNNHRLHLWKTKMQMKLNIQNTFNKELTADPNLNNVPRQVENAHFSCATPRKPTAPKLLHISKEMLANIGLDTEITESEAFLNMVSGAEVAENTKPYAMCYGGHQFGHWAGQLGDGRAINLFEIVHNDQRWALQLKGSGVTPYSRTADGRAVLRSSVREHLCSEAMYALDVPTTRSLSLSLTGDDVLRDMLYNGNTEFEKGAVVCRVAPSFIRFGNFQIFAARKDTESLKKLTDYTIRHFFPTIEIGTKAGYIEFFKTVTERTLDMIIHWQRVGFVHGVMNTDNLSILGLTIDFGPYGWLEGYEKGWTPNTTDRQNRRYRYGQQVSVGLWNLFQLANALYPLVEDVKPLEAILEKYKSDYAQKYPAMMRQKLGLMTVSEGDSVLIEQLESNLEMVETDMTIFFRNLKNINKNTLIKDDFLKLIDAAFYDKTELNVKIKSVWKDWFTRYITRLNEETTTNDERKTLMDSVNPKYVLRNYMAQLAIDKADNGDYSLISELHEILKKPYDEQPESENWFAKRPEWARHKVGCSMLSCSS